jgi:hypothetical protein
MRLPGELVWNAAEAGFGLVSEAIDAVRTLAHGKPPVATVLDMRATEPTIKAAVREPMNITMKDQGQEAPVDVTKFVHQPASALGDRFKFLQRDRESHSIAVAPGSTIDIFMPSRPSYGIHDYQRRVTTSINPLLGAQ